MRERAVVAIMSHLKRNSGGLLLRTLENPHARLRREGQSPEYVTDSDNYLIVIVNFPKEIKMRKITRNTAIIKTFAS